uniref:UV radiation resistance associated protein n=1 Tax=Ciona intestinalis TaxID=7719 RepID=F6RUV6_CIOIN|nr:UV radiation resistance associated protein [Ciona intestinalis]|eukprot:XP_026690118.1 UV radiation resistance associated protein [Ciona intestinalis]
MSYDQEEIGVNVPNIPLVLQQQRLRHITSLFIRNLAISLPSQDQGYGRHNEFQQPHLYFTIHSDETTDGVRGKQKNDSSQTALYESEKVAYTSNPSWASFKINGTVFASLTEFILRLWIGHNGNYMPALHWQISLKKLQYLGKTLFNEDVHYHSNAVVFKMNGLYHGHNTSVNTTIHSGMLDCSDIRNSYSVFALQRIAACYKMNRRSKEKRDHHQHHINIQLLGNSPVVQLKCAMESLHHRIAHLRSLLKREKALLTNERKEANKQCLKLQQSVSDLAKKKEHLQVHQSRHKDSHNLYLCNRENAAHLAGQLALQRRNILSELTHIFPISTVRHTLPSPRKKGVAVVSDVYVICGVKLPDSEHFNTKEDNHTSVALGYAAQLLSMMSQFLLVPLRYQIVQQGSHSSVIDHVTEKLNDKERIFPIYVRGNKDRFLFEYGVFLFNKNIAQLRYHCGLGTQDLRPTLHNIRTLLQDRLGAKPISLGSSSIKSGSFLVPTMATESKSDMLVDLGESSKGSLYDNTVASLQKNAKSTDLSSLRGELFGASEMKKSRDRSPHLSDHRRDTTQFQPLSSKDIRTRLNTESVESVSPSFTPYRTQLTGLEELGQSNNLNNKESFATARAELFGTKSSMQKIYEPTRWGKKVTGKVNSRNSSQRDELFGKSGFNSRNDEFRTKSDTGSSKSSSEAFVEDFIIVTDCSDKEKTPGEGFSYMSALSDHHSTDQIGEENGLSIELKNPNPFRVSAAGQLTSFSQSDDLDLC